MFDCVKFACCYTPAVSTDEDVVLKHAPSHEYREMCLEDTTKYDMYLHMNTVDIEFVDKHGKDKLIKFTRTPSGMAFGHSLPLEITNLESGGHAETLGVEVGFVIKAIQGQPVSSFTDWKEAREAIIQAFKEL